MLITLLLNLFSLPKLLRLHFYPLFNRVLLKAHGVQVGTNIQIPGRIHWTIWGGNMCIGDNFYFSSGDGINPLGSNLEGSIFLESGANLFIGNNVGMSSTRIWVHDSVSVGDNVKFGACVMVTDTDSHPVDYMARRCSNEGTKSKPVTIEDDVWIGAHSIILKGVTIGARSIIGAGSVVTKSIPADCIAAGNPCKIIKNI